MTIKAYSTNDEDFIYLDIGEVLDAMDCEGQLVEGNIYYECDIDPIGSDWILGADFILEEAESRLYNEIGESAIDAMQVNGRAVSELQSLLNEWWNKHMGQVSFWRASGPSRELRVTAEDVAEFSYAQES